MRTDLLASGGSDFIESNRLGNGWKVDFDNAVLRSDSRVKRNDSVVFTDPQVQV